MARRTAIRAVLAMALLTAFPACKSSSADRATANPTVTVATEPAPTTTTNPYAVPAVIDVAYVNRVLAGLDAVMGDVTRVVVHTHTIPREAYDRLRSIYGTDSALQLAIDIIQNDLRNGLTGYSAEPGNQITTVIQLLTTRPVCVFVRVNRNYSAIGPGASASSDKNWIALRPKDNSRDANNYNRIGWTYAYEGFPPDRTQPPDPCAS